MLAQQPAGENSSIVLAAYDSEAVLFYGCFFVKNFFM